MKQSSLKTGAQMIFLQIVFWCMDMLFCEDTTKLHIGMISGMLIIWKLEERRKDKNRVENVVIRTIPITLISIGGIWGGRLLLKSVGRQKAYWIYIGSGIFIELLLAIVGTWLIMTGICGQKEVKK